MTIHLIHHADVIRPIKTTLRSFGVPKRDLEDGVAEVQTRTLEYLQGKALPEGIEQWVALCTTIARNWRLNEKEKRKTEQKYCTGLCEEPDNYVGIERPRRSARRRRRPSDGGGPAGHVRCRRDAGEGRRDPRLRAGRNDRPETATELGITLDAVRWRLDRMRDVFERRLATLGLTAMMLLLVLLAAGPASAASLAPPPSPTEHVPVPPPRIEGVAAAPRAA